MRTGFDMLETLLFQLLFEARRAAPVGVLAAVVGEHLLGNAVLADTPSIGLNDVLGRLAAVQPQSGDVTRIVIQVADQVRVAARQAEGHDIALPHLVGGGALEKPRLGWVLSGLFPGLGDQALFGKGFVNSRWAGGDQEKTLESIADAPAAVRWVRTLQVYDFLFCILCCSAALWGA